MKTYTQVMQEIENLKAQAERLRQKEVDEVVGRIRDAISHYGLSASDLGLAVAAGGGGAAPAKSARKTRKSRGAKKALSTAAKYRNEAGQSWVGRGKRPQWLRDAIAGGKPLQDFLVG